MNHQLTEAIAKRQIHNIKHIGKPPIWKYPRTVEIVYRAFMISIVKELRQSTLDILQHLVPIIADRDREHHMDAWPDNLENLLTTMRIGFNNTSHKERIKAMLTDIGQRTSAWNDAQWQATLIKVLGVDVYRRESFLGSHIKSFVQEGSSLITKLTEDTYNDVTRVITSGIRSGDRVETIQDAIMTETDLGPGVFDKVETRARLIARDQIGKLNGELSRVRQEAIGVKEYIWHTSLDERVRDTHAALEGKTCSWDDGDTYSDDDGKTWNDRDEIDAYKGQPGEDYQCRCWSEAIFPEEDEIGAVDEEGLSDAEAEGRADGSAGSGNFGHAGRPGKIGGSGEGGESKNAHDNSIDTIKQISIEHSDMISKDDEKTRKSKYHNEIDPRLRDEPSQASGKWHLAKKMITVSQEKWQEKDVKDTYKKYTSKIWKPYIDDSNTLDISLDGGSGSGNFGHQGRPGLVGGSGEGGAGKEKHPVDVKFARGEKGNGHEVKIDNGEELKNILDKGHICLISAGRNSDDPQEANLTQKNLEDRHESLKNDLVQSGYAYTPVKGKYGGEEDSFMTMTHDPEDKEMLQLGKKYNQNSVLIADKGEAHNIYTTGKNVGKEVSGKGYTILSKETSDFYTLVEHKIRGATKFSFNLDFEKLKTASVKLDFLL